MKALYEIFNIEGSNNPSSLLDRIYEKIKEGDKTEACNLAVNVIFDELKKIPEKNETFTLFRFSGFPYSDKNMDTDPVISDIKSGSVTFSNPCRFNDPMDPILRVWLELQEERSKRGALRKMFKLMKETVEQIRISCMASPRYNSSILDCSPLMWAHYAKGHRGVCVQYEVTPEMVQKYCDESQVLRIGRVRCRDYKAMSEYITLDNALLAKASDWAYEDEIRLMYFTKKHPVDEKEKKQDFITLNGFPIKAVYMGYRINKKREGYIRNICKERDLPLYKMAFRMDDITKLEVKKVNLDSLSEASKE